MTGAPPAGAPPRLFLVDGYALVYRAFFAMITRPLRTAKGENTSAAWGVANFLARMLDTHRPDYVAWVHDAGDSFRTSRYPDYKSTREKLDEELQADFDTAVERVTELLAGSARLVRAAAPPEQAQKMARIEMNGTSPAKVLLIVSPAKRC